MTTDAIKTWISTAPVETLRAKLDEYQQGDSNAWSGRDNEARARLRSAINAELDRRMSVERIGGPL